jgi:hypothetical protein
VTRSLRQQDERIELERCLTCGGVGFESASGRLFGPQGFFDCPEDGYHGPLQTVEYARVPAAHPAEAIAQLAGEATADLRKSKRLG